MPHFHVKIQCYWIILNMLPKKIDNNDTYLLQSNDATESYLTFDNDDADTSDNLDLQSNIEDSYLILLGYSMNLLQ